MPSQNLRPVQKSAPGLFTQVSYRILGRGYFSTSLFAENKYTEIEGRGSHLK